MNSAVEITEREGRYTARDAATGLTGEGATRAMALLSLAGALQLIEDADTDETAVEEAIRWARSG